MSNTIEFRCTRNAMYDAPGCPGHNDFTARQGHYFHTETVMGAAIGMIASFPKEITQGFTIQDVKGGAIYTWDVATGLIECKRMGKDLQEVHRPGYSTFNLAHRINRGKDMEQERAVFESLESLGRGMYLLGKKLEEDHKKKEQEEREVKQEAEARKLKEGHVLLSGWVSVNSELRKNISFQVPEDIYRKYVEDVTDIDALDKIQDIMEDVSDAHDPSEDNGWSHTGWSEVQQVDFKLEDESDAEED